MRKSMITASYLLLFISPAFMRGQPAPPRVEGRTINLLQGQLFGAALSPSGDVLISQQTDRTATRPDGSGVWVRRLVAVSMVSDSTTQSRPLGELAQGSSGPPCDRIQFLEDGHLIAICSANNAIEVLNAANLETKRTISITDAGMIVDFEVVENTDLALVLRTGERHTVWLDRYNFPSGLKIGSTVMSTVSIGPLHLAVDPQTKFAYASMKPVGKREDTNTLAVCHYGLDVVCKYIQDIPPISQMQMWDRQLLAVTSRLADNKNDCIMSFQPGDTKLDASYCAPRDGVHYAFAVIHGGYLAGFTGMDTYHASSEKTIPKSTSISLWASEVRNPVERVAFPMGGIGSASGTRIVGSAGASIFAAYERTGNSIEVYTVQSTK